MRPCGTAGKEIVFVSDKGHTVCSVSDPDSVKEHLGHHVKIEGTVASGAVTVQNVSMLK